MFLGAFRPEFPRTVLILFGGHSVRCLQFDPASVPSALVSAPMGPGILSGSVEDHRRRHPSSFLEVDAISGLEVLHSSTGRRGVVVSCAKGGVTLRLSNNATASFRLIPGAFRIDGRPVSLRVPRVADNVTKIGPAGSVVVPRTRARVAIESRIWVEGKHDAELVEKIWGDDLRHVGVVVEPMHGMDDLVGQVRSFDPGPNRRLGILLDHLIPGTKESREVDRLTRTLAPARPHVLVVGHPFVDVWEAVKPSVVGIEAWPEIRHGRPWKQGVCERLNVGEPALFWRRVLNSVSSFTDLDISLINSVERLIDFVEGD